MNGTADGILWEEGKGENCSVAMEGLTVTGLWLLYTAVQNCKCDNY
jgi:hypothetical protein